MGRKEWHREGNRGVRKEMQGKLGQGGRSGREGGKGRMGEGREQRGEEGGDAREAGGGRELIRDWMGGLNRGFTVSILVVITLSLCLLIFFS